MNKHTPGPWVAATLENERDSSGDIALLGLGEQRWGLTAKSRATPILIAGVFGCLPSEEDARLIVAAPELLAALKELTEQATQASHWVPHILLLGAIDLAKKALAKAEDE